MRKLYNTVGWLTVSNVVAWLALMLLLCVSIAHADKPCKADKKDRKLQHEQLNGSVLENDVWKCDYMGIDAKTKGTVWFCTNKIDGSHLQATFLDNGKKDKKEMY